MAHFLSQYLRIINLFTGLMWVLLGSAQAQILVPPSKLAQLNEIPSTGAGCILRDQHDRVLFVQDNFTNKISIIGGYRNFNESPQNAVIREAFEEAGIRIEVGNRLPAGHPDHWVFACRALNPVPTFAEPLWDEALQIELYLLNTQIPDLNAEVRRIFFAHLSPALLNAYRFQQTADWLAYWASITPASSSQPVSEYQPEQPWLQQQLVWQQSLHNVLPQSSLWPVMQIFWEPLFSIVLIGVLLMLGRWRQALLITFAIGGILFAVIILKHAFAIPRPFWFTQNWLVFEDGFSLPSSHLSLAGFWLGSALLNHSRLKYGIGLILLALVLTCGAAINLILLEAHYPLDLIAGLSLGLFTSLLIFRWSHYAALRIDSRWQACMPYPWAILSMLSAIAAIILMHWQLMLLTAIFGALLLAVVWQNWAQHGIWPGQMIHGRQILLAVFLIGSTYLFLSHILSSEGSTLIYVLLKLLSIHFCILSVLLILLKGSLTTSRC